MIRSKFQHLRASSVLLTSNFNNTSRCILLCKDRQILPSTLDRTDANLCFITDKNSCSWLGNGWTILLLGLTLQAWLVLTRSGTSSLDSLSSLSSESLLSEDSHTGGYYLSRSRWSCIWLRSACLALRYWLEVIRPDPTTLALVPNNGLSRAGMENDSGRRSSLINKRCQGLGSTSRDTPRWEDP